MKRLPTPILLRVLKYVGHQDWLRFGLRSRLIRRFYNPDTCDLDVDIFALNHHYRGNLKNFVDWLAYFFGAQEKQELLYLARLLDSRHGSVILDVGANSGQHAVALSNHVKVVHAFEPYEPVRALMEARIQQNSIPNVTVHPIALGDADEDLEFYAPPAANTGTASFVKGHAGDANMAVGKLRVVRGDPYISTLGLDRLEFIKIDVEGFERKVLAGLEQTLIRFRPLVFLEYSRETRASFASLTELTGMFPEGYELAKVVADRPYLILFNKARCVLDPFAFDQVGGNILAYPAEYKQEILRA
ncbi:MAG: FkbM family methyltransferase [Methanoregulaceae archaeon]|nr:FkbM family methyltransferase [Methanoregulaceae archaeon]